MRDVRLSPDRAAALAELNASRPVKVIAVTGGKGGVGKTTVSANLAVSIAAQGRDVMLVDADLGLANVDVVLGLHTRFHLATRFLPRRPPAPEDYRLPHPRGIGLALLQVLRHDSANPSACTLDMPRQFMGSKR